MALNKALKYISTHKTVIVWTLRIFVGAVFIVSGLSKAIDVYGTVFKIEEYLEAWGMDFPRSVVIMGGILLSGTEFVLGLLLAVGAYKRTSVWLLLAMMAVMLPLTLYIWIADPVSDCGCFGDFLRLSNAATFWKNVAITVALVILARLNRGVKGLYNAYIQWIVVAVSAIYVFAVALYGLNIQPLVDFRSFKTGTPIIEETDEDADEDATFEYVYSKDGREEAFFIDNLPDSTWTFVNRKMTGIDERRYDKTELNVYDIDGENVTAEVLATEGEQLIIVIPQYSRASVSGTYAINELQRFMSKRDGSVVELISIEPSRLDEWLDLSMASFPVYIAEETTLKELSRGDMSAVYVKDGIIRWKRALPSIDVALISAGKMTLDDYADRGPRTLLVFTEILVAILLMIYFFEAGNKILTSLIRKTNQKH